MEHALIPPVHRHSPYSWVVANAAALDAVVPTADDIGKLAWQQDDDSTWLLSSASPKLWVPASVPPQVIQTLQDDVASLGELANNAFQATETHTTQIVALTEADQGIAATASNAAALASEARDAAEALDLRVDELENAPPSDGGPVSRPGSSSIVLDVPDQILSPLYITGNTTITVTPSRKGAKASMIVVPNGTGVVTVQGAEKWGTTFDYNNTNRVPQLLTIEDKDIFAIYGWSQLLSGAALPSAPTVPGAVASFTAGASGPTTQTLNGSAPATGDPAVFTYTLAYRVNGSGAFPSPQLTGITAFPINVTGLNPSTAYDYQIIPSNSTGPGPSTTLTNVSTAAALQVPGAPTSIAAGTPTSTTIPITFGAPNTGGGSITDYEIQVAPAGTSFASPTTVADGVSATTGGTATGLTASTAYDVRVRAINAAGPGAWATALNISTAAGGGESNQPDVTTMLAQMAADGTGVSQTEIDAANAFETAGRAKGYWNNILRLGIFIGNNAAAGLVPLRAPSGPVRDTNVGMTFDRATGFTTDGTSQYINTGVNPPVTNGGLAIYMRTAQPASGTLVRIPIGSRSSAHGFGIRINSATTGGLALGRIAGSYGGSGSGPYPGVDLGGVSAGMYHVSRTGPTEIALYRNGTQIAQNATSMTPVDPGRPVYVGAYNGDGTAGFWPVAGTSIGGYCIGLGMTAQQVADFYTDMQAFQTAIGRQV